jgi:3-hydroxyisobutyrate dehydrogenase
MSAPVVAVLGTGIMGAGMARSMMRAGLGVRAWNRSAEKARPLADDGAAVCASPEEAVREADVVVTMLRDGATVAGVMTDAAPGLRGGTPWLQTSTVGLDGTRRLADLADGYGVPYFDCPVSGTRQPAEDGELIVLLAGPEKSRPAVDPVLDAIGQRTVWAGTAPGDATRLKLVLNSWLVNLVSAAAESLNVADALGVDPEAFLAAVRGGALDTPYLQSKSRALLSGDLTPMFGLATAHKDTRLILDAVRGTGVPVDLLEASAARFARAEKGGHGGQDMIATYFAGIPELPEDA